MRRALARKRVMLSCFFDIARTFDTVSHGKLLHQHKRAYHKACIDSPRPFSLVVPWPCDGMAPSHQRERLTLECNKDPSSPLSSSPFCFKTWNKSLQKDTTITAYADVLAIWRTTTFRRPNKNGPRQKSASKIFQDEVNTYPLARYIVLLQWNVQLSDSPSGSPGECHSGECTKKQQSSHCGTALGGTSASTSSTQPEYQTPLKRNWNRHSTLTLSPTSTME